MKALKTVMAAVVASAALAAPAFAGTITNNDRVTFDAGQVFLNAKNGADSLTISPAAPANSVIDGNVTLQLDNILYWYDRRNGQSFSSARKEQAKSWDFELSYGGTTVDLPDLTSAVINTTFSTAAFDGVVAGGDWVLSANSDYYSPKKRMVRIDLSGFFDTAAATTGSSSSSSGGTSSSGGSSTSSSSSSSSGGGSVPVPASALFVLVGLAGIGAARRRKANA